VTEASAASGVPSGARERRAGRGPSTVSIRVPATSANLGPAFDCAGLALARYDVLEFTVADTGLTIAVTGEGAHTLPDDETHLVVVAFRAACAELGWSPPGLRVSAVNTIPQGRGMGSSAAAVVAGVLGAWALCPDVEAVDRDAVLRLATEIEGHPDNVAACLLGGATLSWMADDGARAERLEVHPDIAPVLLVPADTLATHVARGLLPAVVPHGDAAVNAGRAALLVQALTAAPHRLFEATEDRLHQGQRAAAMPQSLELMGRLRAAGFAAVVSGAGPSLLVLTRRSAGDAAAEVAAATGPGWTVLPLEVDEAGASVLAEGPPVSSR
jgi:homoserine kinase